MAKKNKKVEESISNGLVTEELQGIGDGLPLVSVLMPIRDGNIAWIREAIESIVDQDYGGNIEFVIVNHDNRLSLCSAIEGIITEKVSKSKLARKSGRVKFEFKVVDVFESATLYSKVLDYGVENCSGEIIVRMDNDDIAKPNLISSTVGFLVANKDIDIVGVQLNFFGDLQLVTNHPAIVTAEVAYNMPGYWVVNHPGATIRRAAIINVGGYGEVPDGYAQDYNLWCKLLKSGRVIANLPDVLIDYRTYEKKGRPAGHLEWIEEVKNQLKME